MGDDGNGMLCVGGDSIVTDDTWRWTLGFITPQPEGLESLARVQLTSRVHTEVVQIHGGCIYKM